MYKNELARAAGVSLKVLNRWLEPHRQQLTAFGVGKYKSVGLCFSISAIVFIIFSFIPLLSSVLSFAR